jgi:hypothetical protein
MRRGYNLGAGIRFRHVGGESDPAQNMMILDHGVRITHRTNTLSLPIRFVGVRNS